MKSGVRKSRGRRFTGPSPLLLDIDGPVLFEPHTKHSARQHDQRAFIRLGQSNRVVVPRERALRYLPFPPATVPL